MTINKDDVARICDARDVLCGYCESDECESCQVTKLVNDAFDELDDDNDGEPSPAGGHDWEPTDSQGYEMICRKCGTSISLWEKPDENGEREWDREIDAPCPCAGKTCHDGEPKKLKAVNIMWDVDDEDLSSPPDLPTEIDIPDGMTDEEEISDYISDLTGFCHYGFSIQEA